MFILTKHPHNNPALESLTVSHETENFKIRIYPNLGASLQEFVKNDIQIIDGITNDETGLEKYKNIFTSAWLFPFPNRIANGKYQFEGKEYHLAINETALNNALHGFVYNKHFKLIEEQISNESAFLKFSYDYKGDISSYPFPFSLEISYKITLNQIEIKVNAQNTGDSNMPFGIGWHPYFKSDNLVKSILNFDGISQYQVNDKMIPTKEIELKHQFPLELGNIFLDDCFITKSASTSFKTASYKLNIDFDPGSERNFIQCYTPPSRESVAIEPMTCAPDVFNNGDGLLVLKPEENYQWKIKMTL